MDYHILIADDATMNRVLIKDILSQSLSNITFAEAENGKEVLEIVHRIQVDLIILDLIMPVLDGYKTLEALKSDPEYRDIPVIVNSSITEIKSIEDTLKKGAVDYFTKPLSKNDMNIILPLKVKNALKTYEQNHTINALNKHISEELKNANAFANIMLPKSNNLKNIDLYIKFHPSLGIGGDFFDCVEIGDKIHFMIADVTGHGIAAGMASSMVKILFRKCIENGSLLPHEILEDMNRSIFSYFDFAGKDSYVVFTAFVGTLENNVLSYANAGHPYPILYRCSENTYEEIEQNGFLVGVMENVTFETKTTQLKSKDFLLLYTDGLFCSGSDSDFTGWNKVFSISQTLQETFERSPAEYLEEIFYAFHMMHKSHHTTFTDDVAMMLIRLR